MSNAEAIKLTAKAVSLRHFFTDVPADLSLVEVGQRWDDFRSLVISVDSNDAETQYMDYLFIDGPGNYPNVPKVVNPPFEYESIMELYNHLHRLYVSVLDTACQAGLINRAECEKVAFGK